MFKKIVWLGFSNKGKNKKDVKTYIQSLVDSWAWEFFTGYNPPYWYEKYGFEVSPNGRFAEHEQITDRETLEEICKEVQAHGLELFVNLNAWYYTDETFPAIQKMVEEFQEIGVDGIICGNIEILEYLKEIGYTWKMNISTILALYNSESIRFFLENYCINKIILSREVTLKEIEVLVTQFPDTSFEVFWEGDFCRYNNGLCYAEHKYGAKDICTVVVNDLIYKKRYNPNFKSVILDESLDNEEKIKQLSDEYKDIFAQIDELTSPMHEILGESIDTTELFSVIYKSRKRVDLFFDAMKPINSEHNRNILMLFKWIKCVLDEKQKFDTEKVQELQVLHDELDISISGGIKQLTQSSKKIGWLPKLRAQELAKFYAKWDNLNLYSYLFFSQFKNIDTVKFPTRGRNYAEKILLIEKILNEKSVDDSLITREISIERTHYDLTYLFWDTLWFRNLIKSL